MVRSAAREPALGAVERPPQARIVQGLQNVVECARFESAQRVRIVCGHENNSLGQVRPQQFEHIEAVVFRHLDVQEHDVGSGPSDLVDGLQSGSTFDHGPDIGVSAQQESQIPARRGFVINHQGSNRTRRFDLRHGHPS